MKKLSLLLILSIMLTASSYNANSQCISQLEFNALVALYNATDGANWTNNTGWDINATPCDVSSNWYGVTIVGGHVTNLQLNNNNLTGNLPPEIGNLTGLINFYAYNNKLTGTIPPEIGLLTSLDYLRLENNQLSGQIPQQIGTLGVLRVLNLYNNNLDGPIPIEFYNMTNLTGVQIYNNDLTGNISPQIGNLTNLRSLYLNGNQLTGNIPSEIGNLSVLMYLYLNGNQLSGNIPPEIGNLPSLQSLSLQQNQLSGNLPASIGGLTNLRLLIIGSNQLEGEIHESILNLNHMTNFQVNDNQFSGTIHPNINNMPNLQYAYFNGNQFTGDFPVIDGLSNLLTLRLNDNKFENLGNISQLASISKLEMGNNLFTFEDIEPNVSITNFTYSPQGKVGEEVNLNIVKGTDYTLSVNVEGTYNTYQWYKNGVMITGANETSYTLPNFSESDVATYHCEIKNTQTTALTLLSNNINLGISIGSVTINAVSITDGTTCTLSGVVPEIEFQSNNTFSFVPETIPGTASLQINTSSSGIKRIRFDIDNNYTITNVQIEVNGTYIPLYNGFYSITKVEENLHSTLQLEQIENICVYYPNH